MKTRLLCLLFFLVSLVGGSEKLVNKDINRIEMRSDLIYVLPMRDGYNVTIEFPFAVQYPIFGNAIEFKGSTNGNIFTIKPLNRRITSNLQIVLSNGAIINFLLKVKNANKVVHRVIFYIEDEDNTELNLLKQDMQKNLGISLANQKKELEQTLPIETMKIQKAYRFSDSKKSTTIKKFGAMISLDYIINNNNNSYLYFSTNSPPGTPCPVSSIKTVMVKKSSSDIVAYDPEPFVNRGDLIIVRTQLLSVPEEGLDKELKLYVKVLMYNEEQTIKAKIY